MSEGNEQGNGERGHGTHAGPSGNLATYLEQSKQARIDENTVQIDMVRFYTDALQTIKGENGYDFELLEKDDKRNEFRGALVKNVSSGMGAHFHVDVNSLAPTRLDSLLAAYCGMGKFELEEMVNEEKSDLGFVPYVQRVLRGQGPVVEQIRRRVGRILTLDDRKAVVDYVNAGELVGYDRLGIEDMVELLEVYRTRKAIAPADVEGKKYEKKAHGHEEHGEGHGSGHDEHGGSGGHDEPGHGGGGAGPGGEGGHEAPAHH